LANGQYKSFFALVRPPGHHSGLKTQPHGFSFFNNIALAANYLTKVKKVKKVAIVDWDAHHGEGTQKIFYQRQDVLVISLHRYDYGKFFPHVNDSSAQNIGKGVGCGYNINICWNL
jgi:histone deacetylase 6